MAEIAHAGAGIDINIKGIDQVRELSKELQNIIKSCKDIVNATQQMDFSIGTMSNKAKSHVDNISDAFKTVIATNRIFNDDVRGTQTTINQMNPNSINRVNDSFKDTINSVHEMQNTISTVARNASDNVRNITNTTNGTSDAVKRLGGAFEPIKPKITEIHEPLGKLHDQIGDLSIPLDSFKRKFHDSTDDVDHDTDKTTSRIGKLREKIHGLSTIAGGTLLAGGISSIASSAKGFITDSANAAIGGQKNATVWQNAIGSNQAQQMAAELVDIRGKSNLAGASITAMQRQFLALTGSAPKARELTEGMAAFGKASGASDEQIQGATQSLSRMFTMAKVRPAMLNKTLAQFPEMKKGLAEAAGMTEQKFTEMTNSGKMTGAQLEAYFTKASQNSGKEWQKYGGTYQGVMDSIKGTFENMKGKFGAPMMAGFTKSLTSITKSKDGLHNVQKELLGMASTMGKQVGNFMGKAVGFLVKNGKPLGSIIQSLMTIIKLLVSGAWNTFSGTIKLITGHVGNANKGFQGTADAVKNLASHTESIKAFGGAIVAAFALTKIVKFITTVKEIASVLRIASAAQWLFNAAMDANPIGLIIVGITAAIAVVVELYKHFKPFRDLVNNVAKWFIKAFGAIIDIAKKVTGAIGDFFGKVGDWAKGVGDKVGSIFSKMRTNVGRYFKGTANDIKKVSQDQNRTQKDQLRIFSDIFHGRFKDLKKDIPKLFNDMFKTIKDIGKTAYNFLNKLTGGKLGDMINIFKDAFGDIRKVWDDAWNGIGHFFEGIWNWIKKIVSNGINGVIGVMNMGISGIDDVISTFGGSKNAIHKIDDVHFAKGTGVFSSQRNPILKPTLATLNDGNDSPATGNKEMVIHANGISELIHGRNTKKWLEPGAEVLNASETSFLMGEHFAKGTGFFSNLWNGAKGIAGDVWDGAKDLAGSIGHKISKMTKILAHPIKFFESMFSQPGGLKGIMQEFGTGIWNKGTDAAKNWWNTLIGMANQAKDDTGGSSSLLKAVEKYGRGNRYVWGATGPDSFDCSGLVQYALDHAFGIHYPRTSGEQINYAEHVPDGQEKPGDLVGNAGHIGVYAGNGQYWAAASPSSHPNIGMWPVSAFPDGPHKFGRVRGIKETSNKDKTAGNGLEKLIKSQTGGFIKWIQKFMGSAIGGGAGNPVGDGVQKWIPLVKKAASQMGVSLSDGGMQAVMHRIQQESNGNPTITNNWDSNAAAGNASVGLVQYTPTTFRNWAVKGHDVLTNGYDQLLALFNDSNWLRDISVPGGWGPTGRKRRAKGGPVLKGQSYLVGEEGQEIFQPNEDGKIIPHNESKRMMSSMNKHSTVSYSPQINIKGDASENTISLIKRVLETDRDKLMDMLVDRMGFNDDGGLNI